MDKDEEFECEDEEFECEDVWHTDGPNSRRRFRFIHDVPEMSWRGDVDEPLAKFIDALQAIARKIPAEYQKDARVLIGSGGDVYIGRVGVAFTRLETDDEMAARVDHERAQAEAEAARVVRRELATLARLKAKYEGE